MGQPAILRIYNDDHEDGAFLAEWGAPAQLVSGLARWIEACKWRHQTPSAANYRDHVKLDPENQCTAEIPATDADPDDLHFRYDLRIVDALYGWGADLEIWTALHRAAPTLVHRISFSNLLTAPIHALAATGLDQLVNRYRALGRSETHDDWERQAKIHQAYGAVYPYDSAVTLAGVTK